MKASLLLLAGSAGLGFLPTAPVVQDAAPSVEPEHPRLVVLGIDGMDPDLLRGVLERHGERAPNLQWLADQAGIHELRTSQPPQSPVAWTNFITGRDPGGHGIYDFLHRDIHTRMPIGATTRPGPGAFFGLMPGEEESNRSGEPFWKVLAEAGVPADIWRMPINFPVEESKGLSFSGMMTPAVDSAYGQASLFTTDPFLRGKIDSDKVYLLEELEDGVIETYLRGPAGADGETSQAPYTVYVDREAEAVAIDTGADVLILEPGQWSDFSAFSFDLGGFPPASVNGVARFYLRSLDPLTLYASPVNIDPEAPIMPVSQPESASADLAEAIGTYYTQGMAEDVNAFKDEMLLPEEFFTQSTLVYQERHRMLDYALDRYVAKEEGGLLFFYFSTVDLMSHMLYRFADKEHPHFPEDYDGVSNSELTGREGSVWNDVVDDIYLRVEPVVAKLRERLDATGQPWELVLMSDHGFAPYRRQFSLNTWLWKNGYLVFQDGVEPDDSWGRSPMAGGFSVFKQIDAEQTAVDWSKTKAYGVGFNGLYLNLAGREGDEDHPGCVTEAEAPALLKEIKAKLEAELDPESGQAIVKRADIATDFYRSTERLAESPDILVGYEYGYGNSDVASLGGFDEEIVFDNLGGTFNGSHLMCPDVVGGILLSTLPVRAGQHGLEDLTVEVLAHYGVDPIEGMIGSRVLEDAKP
ncbi:MAG: alkaline phosphatase family protein [Planctomycetota bacterium]